MINQLGRGNHKILIVDDNTAIHNDFAKILCPHKSVDEDKYEELNDALFNEHENHESVAVFRLDSAYQGEEGFQMVRQAYEAGEPYALAFVDMRMPPGWDGMETISRMWEVDLDLQVVICTAYSDHSWDELVMHLGCSDRLLILKKPFDSLEVRQIACALTEKWSLLRANRDTTRDLELAVKKLEIAADQLVQRNAELEEFTYLTSHDMQEPLRKLSWFTEMLASDMRDNVPEQVENDIRFINEATQRMQSLVHNVSRLSRMGRCRMSARKTSMNECVDNALASLSSLVAKRGAEVSRNNLPEVIGDPGMLTQVLENLIANALEFTPSSRRPSIHIFAEPHGDQWVFSVQDNGMGINRDNLGKVFTPFIRLDENNERQGTGVGLAICRKAIERHDGRIWVESAPGQGAHFKFTVGLRQGHDTWPMQTSDRQMSCL